MAEKRIAEQRLIKTILSRVDDLIVTIQAAERIAPKLPIRKYDSVKDELCPYCHTQTIGWLVEDYYPDGVDDYMASCIPELRAYVDKPYRVTYPEREVLQCVKCGKIIDLYGEMLEHAEALIDRT